MEIILQLLTVGLLVLIGVRLEALRPRGTFRSRNVGKGEKTVFVDTSALMDGRIAHVAKAGFMPGLLAIPRSVVAELQMLADNGDSSKRARARYGLDLIKELQNMPDSRVSIISDGIAKEGVDNRLLELARNNDGIICTLDYNLNKVAAVENIKILNINELAQSLRMAHMPGEIFELELKTKGQDSHQAVGHLSDGTMVVVEHASKYIGKTKPVEVIRSLQTEAGKMMFARISPLYEIKNGESVAATKPSQNSTTEKPEATKKASKRPQGRKPRDEQKMLEQSEVAITTKDQNEPSPKGRVRAYHAIPAPSKAVKKAASNARTSNTDEPKRRTGVVKTQLANEPSKVAKLSKRPKTQAQREASFIALIDETNGND
ncbi:hypothetical protein FJZ39_00850 [Candidatus Saccharibacteria bacterium]|nr:hypothetical protein [Candidatus Saccharibacteria bacterium]